VIYRDKHVIYRDKHAIYRNTMALEVWASTDEDE
jgi:hypothetical protein